MYNKCQAIEQALQNQLINAISAEYLDVLRNVDTYLINETIQDSLEATQYDPQQPGDIVFDKIKLFDDLGTLTGNNKTGRQLVQLAYLVFNMSRAYVDSLKTWNFKNATDKTFSNLRDEYHTFC